MALASFVFVLGLGLGSGFAGGAEESAMLHIRARSQLRLREGDRDQKRGIYRLNVLVQLDDSAHEQRPGEAANQNETSTQAEQALRSFTGTGQRILLTLDGDEAGPPLHLNAQLVTDESGAASYRFAGLPTGRYRVSARYDGDAERDGSTATLDVDLDRRPAELYLDVPAAVRLGEALPVKLALRSAGQTLSAAVELRVGDSYRRTVQTDAAGAGGFSRESVRLPAPPLPGAMLAVEASFAGDEETAPALSRRTVQITTQAQVTLDVTAARPSGARGDATLELAQDSQLILFGTAVDDSGPLAGEPVDIDATSGSEHRRLGSVLTDEKGRYELRLRRLPLRVGPAFLLAQVTPTPRHRHVLSGHSAELPITVLPPEPVSLFYFLLPLFLSAAGAMLFFAERKLRPRLLGWLAAWRAARSHRSAAPGQVRPPPLALTGEAGVTLGSQRSGLTLRRTVDTTIDGTVHDAVFGPAIVGATLRLLPMGSEGREGALAVTTTDDGRFLCSSVLPGRYLMQISAPGYLPAEFSASIPHRGELRGIAVRLMPVRARLHEEWLRVALSYYVEESQLLTRTPQELLRDMEQGRVEPRRAARVLAAPERQALRRLTALVEQGYYSQRLCTQEMLKEAAGLAAMLLAPAAGAPAGPARRDVPIRAPGAPRPLI